MINLSVSVSVFHFYAFIANVTQGLLDRWGPDGSWQCFGTDSAWHQWPVGCQGCAVTQAVCEWASLTPQGVTHLHTHTGATY